MILLDVRYFVSRDENSRKCIMRKESGAGIDTSPKNEGKMKPFWEKGNPSQYPFSRKGKRLPDGCRMLEDYPGWFIGGADLILSIYGQIKSMSTDMFIHSAPPSNRW